MDSLVPTACAPYGGLFLSRQALMLSELPDRRFFCYYDDLDYTGRLAEHGVSFKIYTGARIRDLEYSWYVSNGRVHPLFSPHTSDRRVFFDLRNAFIFYRSRIRSRAVYVINGIGFWLFVAYLAVFRSADLDTTWRRLATIRRAVRFGSRGEFASYCEPK
jgi:GT2 family glycosyltransferase